MPWTKYDSTGAAVKVSAPHAHAYHTNRTRYIYVPASGMQVDDATKASTGSSSPDLVDGVLFADAARQGAYFTWLIPADYASGTISYTLVWTSRKAASVVTRWLISSEELAAGDNHAEASDDLDEVIVDIATTASVVTYSADATWVFTPVAAGNAVKVNVERAGAAAEDTNDAGVLLIGVRIAYTADM